MTSNLNAAGSVLTIIMKMGNGRIRSRASALVWRSSDGGGGG